MVLIEVRAILRAWWAGVMLTATTPKSLTECICGGKNHSAGLQRAGENTREQVEPSGSGAYAEQLGLAMNMKALWAIRCIK